MTTNSISLIRVRNDDSTIFLFDWFYNALASLGQWQKEAKITWVRNLSGGAFSGIYTVEVQRGKLG
ncbi:hypothetical protein L484_026441 [Morus notabilis]|uniref:Uncharacterized protein n=1 Tax=Morus notabilis TaxID=981085 RepID=W9QYW0_9ROSA|nr:hypothetical protein L484_026441 [Morus notabilis]